MYKELRNYENLERVIYKGVGRYNIPAIRPVTVDCDKWIGFNYVKGCKDPDTSGVHFFIDDYQFARVWTHPNTYTNFLKRFKVVCAPDFSTYVDFPMAIQIYNHYRKHWLAAYWQQLGLTVIPTISWSNRESFKFCFDGEPVGGCVAVSSVGTQISGESRSLFVDGYMEMLSRLNPRRIYFYGNVPQECLSPNVEIINIKPYCQKWRAQGGRGSSSGFSSSNFVTFELAPDLKTALGSKGAPYSIHDSYSYTNPGYGVSLGFSENCTRCVVAYELRRRGYDVTALPSYSGDKWQDVSINDISSADRWKGAFKKAKTVFVGSGSVSGAVDNIKKQMRQYGSGSRAVINIPCAGKDINHVFNVENVNGRIHFIDAQSGQRYTRADMIDLFRSSTSKDVSLTRTDNLKISNRALYFVKQSETRK